MTSVAARVLSQNHQGFSSVGEKARQFLFLFKFTQRSHHRGLELDRVGAVNLFSLPTPLLGQDPVFKALRIPLAFSIFQCACTTDFYRQTDLTPNMSNDVV